jgi:DNA-binding IclR family transcriptional regulator
VAENVQSVVRAFALVRALALASEPVGLGDLALQVALPKSTARRLLVTLETIGVVDRGPEPGTYLAGAGLTALAGTGHGIGSLHALAGPFLRDIVELFAEDATLAIVDGTSVLFTEQVVGPNPIQVPDGTGMRYPLHTVASGYVFIATYSRGVGAEGDLIVEKVGQARELGYAWHDGWVDGITAVAAPVRTETDVVGTIGAFGPSYRFPGERLRADIGEAILLVAARLSQLLH